MHPPSFKLALWVHLVIVQCAKGSLVSTRPAKQEAAVTKVFVTLVGAGGCSGGVYRTNTAKESCQFWYSLTCGSSDQQPFFQNVLQGPATLNAGYISISPAYSQNETCTLYGLTSGACVITVYYTSSSSQPDIVSTESVSYYTTLTPGDFNVVPITAVDDNTGLLSSVARCMSSTALSATTISGGLKTGITSPTSTSTSAANGQSSEVNSTKSQEASGLSVGEKAGIGVGAGVGGMILLGLGALLLVRFRARKHKGLHRPPEQETREVGGGKKEAAALYEIGQEEKEMPTNKEAHELSSQGPMSELAV